MVYCIGIVDMSQITSVNEYGNMLIGAVSIIDTVLFKHMLNSIKQKIGTPRLLQPYIDEAANLIYTTANHDIIIEHILILIHDRDIYMNSNETDQYTILSILIILFSGTLTRDPVLFNLIGKTLNTLTLSNHKELGIVYILNQFNAVFSIAEQMFQNEKIPGAIKIPDIVKHNIIINICSLLNWSIEFEEEGGKSTFIGSSSIEDRYDFSFITAMLTADDIELFKCYIPNHEFDIKIAKLAIRFGALNILKNEYFKNRKEPKYWPAFRLESNTDRDTKIAYDAIRSGSIEMVEFIYTHIYTRGKSVDDLQEKYDIMLLAIDSGNPNMVKFIFRANMNTLKSIVNGTRILHRALKASLEMFVYMYSRQKDHVSFLELLNTSYDQQVQISTDMFENMTKGLKIKIDERVVLTLMDMGLYDLVWHVLHTYPDIVYPPTLEKRLDIRFARK